MTHQTKRLTFAALAAAATLNLLPGAGPAGRAFAALSSTQMVDLLKMVDDRQKNNGDWRAQAYLRIDKNLWFYDPSIGKWERRTERERIGGTNSRRSDFDESRLSEEYDPADEGEEKLGVYTA